MFAGTKILLFFEKRPIFSNYSKIEDFASFFNTS